MKIFVTSMPWQVEFVDDTIESSSDKFIFKGLVDVYQGSEQILLVRIFNTPSNYGTIHIEPKNKDHCKTKFKYLEDKPLSPALAKILFNKINNSHKDKINYTDVKIICPEILQE